jgi:GT2 family glycosyltransferase
MSAVHPRVAAVVVNHDNHEDTLRCLQQLRASRDVDLQIVLIDNSPAARRDATLLARDDLIDRLVLARNGGFSAACNIGLRWALAQQLDYVWLVNPDLLSAPTTLAELLGVAEADPQLACCGPKIVYEDRPAELQFAGGFCRDDAAYWFPRGSWETDAGQYDRDEDVDWISGACALLRVAAIRQVGLMDQRFFLYYEDVDWCIRAGRQGWRCRYVGSCRVLHKGSRSTSAVKRYYYPRAHLLFHQKHYPKLLLPALRRYYHHYLRPHLRQRAWAEVTMDLNVCAGFALRSIQGSAGLARHG